MNGSEIDSALFVSKAVRHKKGAVLFFEPVMLGKDIFPSPYWIKSCPAVRGSQLHFLVCMREEQKPGSKFELVCFLGDSDYHA